MGKRIADCARLAFDYVVIDDSAVGHRCVGDVNGDGRNAGGLTRSA